MVVLITNTRTKETKVINPLKLHAVCMPVWHTGQNPNMITLEQAADLIINRISATYPRAWKIVHNAGNHISIMAGNVTKCIFEIRAVEELRDYDDNFLC